MEGAQTHAELRAKLIGKAAADDGFRAKLVEDPKTAIKEALNLDLPDAVTVHVHEETASAAHLVLPPSPGLTEADLEGIAAGHTHGAVYGEKLDEHDHLYRGGGGANSVGYFLDDAHYNGDEPAEHEHIPSA